MHAFLYKSSEELIKQEDKEERRARKLESITVIYARLQGIHELMTKENQEEVSEFLEYIINKFDSICEKNNLFKVYYRDNCYLCFMQHQDINISDNQERADNINKVIEAAGSMMEEFVAMAEKKRLHENKKISLKIGVATGSAYETIVGSTLKHYDIFGQAVNKASEISKYSEYSKSYCICFDTKAGAGIEEEEIDKRVEDICFLRKLRVK